MYKQVSYLCRRIKTFVLLSVLSFTVGANAMENNMANPEFTIVANKIENNTTNEPENNTTKVLYNAIRKAASNAIIIKQALIDNLQTEKEEKNTKKVTFAETKEVKEFHPESCTDSTLGQNSTFEEIKKESESTIVFKRKVTQNSNLDKFFDFQALSFNPDPNLSPNTIFEKILVKEGKNIEETNTQNNIQDARLDARFGDTHENKEKDTTLKGFGY